LRSHRWTQLALRWHRNEVGALLVSAGLASAREHALVSLLALNGLRVSRRSELT
jgi:integrase/recombinase XerD